MRKASVAVKLPCYELGDTFGYEESMHEELLTSQEVKELGLSVFNLYDDEETYYHLMSIDS